MNLLQQSEAECRRLRKELKEQQELRAHFQSVNLNLLRKLDAADARLRELQQENEQLRARAVVAEQHKVLSLLGKSEWQEVVEEKLRVELAETQVKLEDAEAERTNLQQQLEELKRLYAEYGATENELAPIRRAEQAEEALAASQATLQQVERKYGRSLITRLIPRSVQTYLAAEGDDIGEMIYKLVQALELDRAALQQCERERDILKRRVAEEVYAHGCTLTQRDGLYADWEQAESELARLRRSVQERIAEWRRLSDGMGGCGDDYYDGQRYGVSRCADELESGLSAPALGDK